MDEAERGAQVLSRKGQPSVMHSQEMPCFGGHYEDHGPKTESIFERCNIKTTDDVKEPLVKVGPYKPATVSPIAEKSAAR
jgi:hypothetical protein